MAITQTGIPFKQKLPKSVREDIAGAFSTTDTSGTITTSLKRIRRCTFTLVKSSALAAAECLSLEATVDADGFVTVPSSGQLTIGRVGASVTSGLTFIAHLEGY